MFLLTFCGFCAQNFWRARTFSGNYPELKRILRPKLREDQKKRSSA